MAEYPDDFQSVLPEDYLIAIGNVTVVWGHLEAIADLAINKFAGNQNLDWRCTILTAHMSWPQKMDVLESLVDGLRSEYPHLSRFDAVKRLLRKAQEGRNRIAHGQWGYNEGTATKARATARGKLLTSIDPISVETINAIARDIGRAAMGLFKIVVNR